MKRLFVQITFVLSLLYFGNAFAQQVVYSLKDGSGQYLGQMIINYKSNGYEAMAVGSNRKVIVEDIGNTTIVTMGKLIITMQIDGSYYHNRIGQWRLTQVTTSFGDKGVVRMFYTGLTPRGRLYYEELWLNGRPFNRSETVIDHNDQIVWSIATDSEGTLRIDRM
jgi:hypothetical protein